MSSASFRNQIAGVVSDTLYIPVKQFWASIGKAAKAVCFACVGFFVSWLFCFKEVRGKMSGGGRDRALPTVKVELVNQEQCCIYNFHPIKI